MGSALTYKLIIHDNVSGEDLTTFDFAPKDFEESSFMNEALEKELNKNQTLYKRRVADKIAHEIDDMETDILSHYSDAVKHFLYLIRKYEEYAKWSGEASRPDEAYESASEQLFAFFKQEENYYLTQDPDFYCYV